MTTTAPSAAPERRRTQAPPPAYRPLPRWLPPALAVAALGLALLVRSAVGTGVFLTVLVAALLYVAALNLASRRTEGARRATDRTVTAIVSSTFLLAVVPLVSLLFTVLRNGAERFDAAFFTTSMRNVVGEGGGGVHAIYGTLWVTGIATLISVPIGLFCAIYLVEYGRGRLARAVTFLVDVMTGIPSIVAGLFAYALFVVFFGPGVRFGIGGAVALSVLMIPVVVRAGEEMLKLVPAELREAAYALGVPKWKTIVKVVLPVAAAGIGTGITLAIARIIGETAPLLLIAGYTASINNNPLEGRMATLPVFAFQSFRQPGANPEPSIDRAWTAALVLMLIVLLLNAVARLVAKAFAPKGAR